MGQNIKLSRDQAEWLVDLLEEADPLEVGTWRVDLSESIRAVFGMCSKEREAK